MRQTTLLERIIVMAIGEYTRIEEWTVEMNKKEEHKYIQSLVFAINEHFPDAAILSAGRYPLVEARSHPCLAFDGYLIKVAGVSPLHIKLFCMERELNEKGERIADLDVYYKERKISRKTIQ